MPGHNLVPSLLSGRSDRSKFKMAYINEIFLLSLLYFGQGLPYGFQVKVLPLFLRTRNISLSGVSLSRLLSLPWIFKFAIAPLVDSIWSLRFWITSGLLGMTTFCLLPAILGVNNTHILLVCVFGMNLTTAAQDVAVDALAIRFLPPSKLGEFMQRVYWLFPFYIELSREPVHKKRYK